MAEDFLAKYDEEIDEVRAELEAVRSREQGVPLETGCALFALFGVAVVVLAFFVTIGQSYFGGWLFYVTLGVVIVLAIRRIRRRLTTPAQLRALRERRAELETGLSLMESERERMREMFRTPTSERTDAAPENGG